MRTKKVLFVCTGNVFRSLSAEYLLKKYLEDNKISGWEVSSAGIIAKKQEIDPETLKSLKKLGVKKINHTQKKLTKNLLKKYDVIIPMAENHKKFINSKFGLKTLLFNELANNKKTSIWDIENEVKDWKINRTAVEEKIRKTVNKIFKSMPLLFKNMSEKYFLFEDLVRGKRKHRNGFPFIKLYETKRTVAFMSLDIPGKEDGHILVIPKKRYAELSDIPKSTQHELIESVAKIGKSLTKNHGGYNVLLNNDSEAGQYIFHTHFHIIPRNYDDKITIEKWKKRTMSVTEFKNLNKKIKKIINKT